MVILSAGIEFIVKSDAVAYHNACEQHYWEALTGIQVGQQVPLQGKDWMAKSTWLTHTPMYLVINMTSCITACSHVQATIPTYSESTIHEASQSISLWPVQLACMGSVSEHGQNLQASTSVVISAVVQHSKQQELLWMIVSIVIPIIQYKQYNAIYA
jgi:hypothetical protein